MLAVPGGEVVVTDSWLVEANNVNYYGFSQPPAPSRLQALEKRVVPGALHNSGERFDSPKCHPNTRTTVLRTIMMWSRGKSDGGHPRILWLHGPAGAGKSAIAQTVAEILCREGTLAAAFFFSRTAPKRNIKTYLITTLAYQLLRALPDIRPHVNQAIEDDPFIFDKTLKTQLQDLIAKPVEAAHPRYSGPPLVIIIDGLDECSGEGHQSEILSVFASYLRLANIPLILMVVSRPETEIRNTFQGGELENLTQFLALDHVLLEANADIELLLRFSFAEIKKKYCIYDRSWPGERAIQAITRKSSGQFIYASTVLKYVGVPRSNPCERLDEILHLRSSKAAHSDGSSPEPDQEQSPLAQLDALYTHILSSIPESSLQVAFDVFAYLLISPRDIWEVTSSPIPCSNIQVIQHVLFMDFRQINQHLLDLHSILAIPPLPIATESDSLRFYHASFGDFLTDRSRSGKFYMGLKDASARIARCFFKRVLAGMSSSDAQKEWLYRPRLREEAFRHLLDANADPALEKLLTVMLDPKSMRNEFIQLLKANSFALSPARMTLFDFLDDCNYKVEVLRYLKPFEQPFGLLPMPTLPTTNHHKKGQGIKNGQPASPDIVETPPAKAKSRKGRFSKFLSRLKPSSRAKKAKNRDHSDPGAVAAPSKPAPPPNLTPFPFANSAQASSSSYLAPPSIVTTALAPFNDPAGSSNSVLPPSNPVPLLSNAAPPQPVNTAPTPSIDLPPRERLQLHQLDPVNVVQASNAASQLPVQPRKPQFILLEDIETWICTTKALASIYVLQGPAGVGKSTAARKVADQAGKAGLLGATFAFCKEEPEMISAKHLFPAIAFQLAHYDGTLAENICNALDENPGVLQMPIHEQFKQLILNPLKEPLDQKASPIFVVIDALDECNEDGATALLKTLAEYANQISRVKFFIATQPRQQIQAFLEQGQNQNLFNVHTMEEELAEADIQSYVLDKGHSPDNWLLRVLQNSTLHAAHVSPPKASLMDKLYAAVIRSSAQNDPQEYDSWVDRYQKLVGTLVLLIKPFSSSFLSRLLDAENTDITRGLHHICLLILPNNQYLRLGIRRQSFLEFITNKHRIKNALGNHRTDLASSISIDMWMHNKQMCLACFRIMDKELKRNIGNLSPTEWYKDKEAIPSVRSCVSEELAYAAKAWGFHLFHVGVSDDDLRRDLTGWSQKHILAWLETLCIINGIREARFILGRVLDQIERTEIDWKERITVRELLYDTLRLTMQNHEWMQISPMHTYFSSIPFLPHHSGLSQRFSPTNGVKAIAGLKEDWDPTLATLNGHSKRVNAVAFSPDSWTLATASYDKTIKLWDGKVGYCEAVLKGHSGPVNAITFSSNGSLLASGSEDRTIRLWNKHKGAEYRSVPLIGHASPINDVVFSPDDSLLASASDDGTIRIWAGNGYSQITILRGHMRAVNTVSFSSDGLRLASASFDQTIRLWNVETGSHLFTLPGHWDTDSIFTVAFSPDGTKLASGSKDNEMRVWDSKTGTLVAIFRGHTDWVNIVAFSPDGSRLASASHDKTIWLYNGRTGVPVASLRGHTDWVTAVSFSSDSSKLASASSDNTIRVWDGKTGAAIATFEGHTSWVTDAKFSPDGTRIASASYDNTARLWDLTITGRSANVPSHSESVAAVAFSFDGSRLASASYDKTVRLWDGRTGAPITVCKGHKGSVTGVAFSFSTMLLASCSSDNTVRVWNGATGAHMFTLEGHSSTLRGVAMSPDGSQIASASSDNTARLWSARNGSLQAVLKGHTGRVNAIAFSPDSSRVVTASSDKTVRLWNSRTGYNLETYAGHSSPVTSAAYSPDSSAVAALSADRTMQFIRNGGTTHIASMGETFNSTPGFAFLPCSPPEASQNSIHRNNGTSHQPHTKSLHAIVVGQRKCPSVSGLVALTMHPDGNSEQIPFCWFPPQFHATAISVNHAGSLVAVGCGDGRILLLDISRLNLTR